MHIKSCFHWNMSAMKKISEVIMQVSMGSLKPSGVMSGEKDINVQSCGM